MRVKHIPIGVDGGVGSGSGIMVGPKFGISAFSRSACKCRFLKGSIMFTCIA